MLVVNVSIAIRDALLLQPREATMPKIVFHGLSLGQDLDLVAHIERLLIGKDHSPPTYANAKHPRPEAPCIEVRMAVMSFPAEVLAQLEKVGWRVILIIDRRCA